MKKETKKIEITYDVTPSGKISNAKMSCAPEELSKVLRSGDGDFFFATLSAMSTLYILASNREIFLAKFLSATSLAESEVFQKMSEGKMSN